MSNYDVGVIGVGVAGAFACLKIAKEHKNLKVIAFDLGRPPLKRRSQMHGFLGCLPNSDGKLYLNDLNNVSELIGGRKTKNSFNWYKNIMSNIGNFKITKDKSPSVSMEKKLNKNGYSVELNDFIQVFPKDIHSLSKFISNIMEKDNSITFSFDNEIKKIYKSKNMFNIIAENNQEYKCKKLIIAVGRSGWRWARDLYKDFGIIENNDYAKFGVRVEASSSVMKDFNKSNCSFKKDDLEIGPLSWFGTIIPEDHVDLAISSFRSNENRWKSDKVSFVLTSKQYFENNGFEQTDRIGKLSFILANDRIIKERISTFMNNKSKISIIKEYEWLKGSFTQLATIIPEISSKGYFHVPTIIPMTPQINVGNNLASEIDGMFVAGESAGIHGILAAACTGIVVGDSVCK